MGNVKATVFEHERYLTEKRISSIPRWHPEGTARGLHPRRTLPPRESELAATEDRKQWLRGRACAVRMELRGRLALPGGLEESV